MLEYEKKKTFYITKKLHFSKLHL